MSKKITAILGSIGGVITAIALLLNALEPYVHTKPVASVKPQGYVQPTPIEKSDKESIIFREHPALPKEVKDVRNNN